MLLFALACALPTSVERIPLRDGTSLTADVFLPPGDGPFPTVLVSTPYARGLYDGVDPGERRDDGVAVVRASAGDLLRLADDGEDTLDWIAGQRWSDGRVVTWGPSAMGIAQYAVAPREHPAHAGLIATMATGDPFGDAIFPGGLYRERLVERWLGATGNRDLLPALDPLTPWEVEMVSQIPGQHVGGWYDLFAAGTVRAFVEAGGAATGQRLVMGPWDHEGFGRTRIGARTFPDADLDLDAERDAFLDALLAGDAAPGPPVRVYVLGSDVPGAPGNAWVDADAWPPQEHDLLRVGPASGRPTVAVGATRSRQLILRSDGTLGDAADGGPPTVIASDPSDPVRTRCGRNLFLPSGPCDIADRLDRPDVVGFTTGPLAEPLVMMGSVSLSLRVRADQPDADVIAHLADLHPDGRAMLLAEGGVRLSARSGGHDPLAPGQTVRATVDLGPLAAIVAAGNRLQLTLAGSDAPRFAVGANDGAPFGAPSDPRPVRVEVLHGPGDAVLSVR